MRDRLVGIVCVLLGTAFVAAQGRSQRGGGAPIDVAGREALPYTFSMTCRDGRYAEMDKLRPALDVNCQRQPGLSATALAIEVAATPYAYTETCPGGYTDSTALAMAKSRIGTPIVPPMEVLGQLQRRASVLGKDASSLVVGGAVTGTARCQLFVLQTPVPASAIRYVEFRAVQNQASDNAKCFEAKPSQGMPSGLGQNAGLCDINWSGWQSATLVDDAKSGAIVAGVFKNWSNDRVRTGQLWVWYAGAGARGSAPSAPTGLRIVQ